MMGVVIGRSAGQMKWTDDCEKALEQAAAGSKNATKKLYKKWIAYLNKLTGMTRVKLHVIDRNKVVNCSPPLPSPYYVGR
jgi:hypothetical protein